MEVKEIKKVTVVGASIGGLVAAAELSNSGFDVTIVEKGKSVGGLYNKVKTPFGEQELGMHVLYVSEKQFAYLSEIFGENTFNTLSGGQVDVGSCENFGSKFFNSHYPNVLGHKLQDEIIVQIKNSSGKGKHALNAKEEVINRFGKTAGTEVVGPILEKLWKKNAELLTPHAINCFFDLRRVVACTKQEADTLKTDAWLDSVLANPEQSQPAGEVHGGRIGLTFNKGHGDLSESVSIWAEQRGIHLQFETEVSIDGGLHIANIPAQESCDACIIALPIHSLAPNLTSEIDQLELSIYYLQTSDQIGQKFPAYYLLSHSGNLKASRIVNYDGYNQELRTDECSILAVEVIHEIGLAPSEQEIVSEVEQLFPDLSIKESYQLSKSVKICSPTIKNSIILDSISRKIEQQFGNKPVYFSGMRTDQGVFFSHHTIGASHEAALECKQNLPRN